MRHTIRNLKPKQITNMEKWNRAYRTALILQTIDGWDVLKCLGEGKWLCVMDLMFKTRREESVISTTARKLFSVGLLEYRRQGKQHYYRISEAAFNKVLAIRRLAALVTTKKKK